jgi:hypothetical protein
LGQPCEFYLYVCENAIALQPGGQNVAVSGCYAQGGDRASWSLQEGEGMVSADHAERDVSCKPPADCRTVNYPA